MDGAQIGAERDLLHAGEAELLEGLAELVDVALAAELADEGGRDLGNDLVAGVDGHDHLEDLALVGDGAEGTVDQALTAADALLVVDLCVAVLVGADGAHAARHGAGTLEVMDGVVGAGLGAQPAVDALLLIDVGLLVLEGDGALGADLAAGVREAALAGVAHLVDVVLAGVAGELDDVDQRRLVVGLGNRGVDDAVGHALRLVDALQRQAHGQANALRHDGALEEDGLAVGRDLAGDDLVGQALEISLGVLPLLVGDAGDAREDLSANLGKVGVDTAHSARHVKPLSGWCGGLPQAHRGCASFQKAAICLVSRILGGHGAPDLGRHG